MSEPPEESTGLTRRRVLGSLVSVGAFGAVSAAGVRAYLADAEVFEANRLLAGSFDMKVSWEEHVFDPMGEEIESERELFPDRETRDRLDDGDVDPCDVLADVPEDLDGPLIDLTEVEPRQRGEVTFDFTLCDNPGLVWMTGALIDEGTLDDGDGDPNLADHIEVTIWYDEDCDNTLDGGETVIFEGSLRSALDLLSETPGLPLSGDHTVVSVSGTGDCPPVDPIQERGNPRCSGESIKFEDDTFPESVGDSETIQFNGGAVTITATAANDDGEVTQIRWVSDGLCFESAIVKGGPEANIYEYGDCCSRDEGLTIPDDGREISHVSFCAPRQVEQEADGEQVCFSASPDRHCIGFEWQVPPGAPMTVGNEFVEFDLGFYAEQCRHNEGAGDGA